MSEAKFKVGDIVQFITGEGPKMVVFTATQTTPPITFVYKCAWFCPSKGPEGALAYPDFEEKCLKAVT